MTPPPTQFPDQFTSFGTQNRGVAGLVVGSDGLAAEAIATSLNTAEAPVLAVTLTEAMTLLPRSSIRVVVVLPMGVDVSELVTAVRSVPGVRFVVASSQTTSPAPIVDGMDLVLATNLPELIACVREVLVLRPSVVTERSKQILQRLAKGDSPAQAATMLGIKVGTLNNQLSVIYEQMGVRNATEAVLAALRAGLIQL